MESVPPGLPPLAILVLDSFWRGYDDFVIKEEVIQSEINQIDYGDYPLFYSNYSSPFVIASTSYIYNKQSMLYKF